MWGTAKQMALLAQYANMHGFNVITLSLRHHWGITDEEALGKTSTADFVTDVKEVLQNLFNNESFILVGHSSGGLVAQCLLGHKAVEGCVLLASAPPKGILAVSPGLLLRTARYLPAIIGRKPCRVRRQDILYLCFNGNEESLSQTERLQSMVSTESGLLCRERFFSLVKVEPPTNPSKPVLILADPNDRACPISSQKRLADFHKERLHVSRNPCHHMFHTVPGSAIWCLDTIADWAAHHKFRV